jgi:hypothetical protein
VIKVVPYLMRIETGLTVLEPFLLHRGILCLLYGREAWLHTALMGALEHLLPSSAAYTLRT